MANKITKREVINMMMAEEMIKANQVYMDYLAHEIELLDKKSGNKGESKVAKANAELYAVILDILTSATEPMSIKEILSADDRLAVIENTQKFIGIIKPYLGVTIERSVDKRVVKYSLIREQ